MKEAAGEANMTVITIVLIAIVLAVGTVIVTNVMNSTKRKSCCTSLGGELNGSTCEVKLSNGAITSYTTADEPYASCIDGD